MTKYKVIIARHVAEQVMKHVEFISNVSPEFAGEFVTGLDEVVARIGDNPFQFQVDTAFDNPEKYRRAIFAKWYKCIFIVEETTVFIDSIVDCRQDNKDPLL